MLSHRAIQISGSRVYYVRFRMYVLECYLGAEYLGVFGQRVNGKFDILIFSEYVFEMTMNRFIDRLLAMLLEFFISFDLYTNLS